MIDRILTPTQTTNYQTNTVQRDTPDGQTPEPAQSNEYVNKNDKEPKGEIEKVIDGMNDFVSVSNSHLKFELHDKLQEYYVTIVDDRTKEVIKEIPSKRLLDIYAEMKDFLGLLVDKKI